MKKTFLLLVLTMAALSQASFGMLREPSDALELIKPHIETMVERETDRVVPISMHAHYLAEIHVNLHPGKFEAEKFADFAGTVTGKYRLMGRLYPFSCSVSSRVSIVNFAMQPPGNIILEEQGPNQDQLVGKVKLNCK